VETRRLKNALFTVLIAAAVALGVIAMLLLSQTVENSERFSRLQNVILLVNVVGVIMLLGVIVSNLAHLVRDYRRKVPGARLKARMVLAFVGLSVVPLVLVYYFAVQFLNRGIETWFDVEVEKGLNDALQLSRAALDVQMRENLQRTRSMSSALAGLDGVALVDRLAELRRETNAREATLFGDNYQILATSSDDRAAAMPSMPPDEVSIQLLQARPYVALTPLQDGGFEIRTAVILPRNVTVRGERVLQVLFPVAERLSTLAESVQYTYSRYGEIVFLREPLKNSFTLTLTLAVLLSFLTAVYGAFFFARRLVAPIQNLVAGTRAVAKGDFDTRLPMTSHDEIGFLIDSFNAMIQRLARAREEARLSEQQVESERANLEALLARLSTGVIALEPDLRLRIANDAADTILGEGLSERVGIPLDSSAIEGPLLTELAGACRQRLEQGRAEWREQLFLHGEHGRRALMVACTMLPGEEGEASGYVIVFDDITALLQAQRDAAWGEVARRLAHEIKNPLTPIQLSAERIRRKYLDSMEPLDARVLDRATHTIVQQVEAMRDMVNAFSDYARAPELTIKRFELNTLVTEVADLYRVQGYLPALTLDLDDDVAELEADPGRIRQVLHNLIRNAHEATEGQSDAEVRLSTRRIGRGVTAMAELRVCDNGPGFEQDDLAEIFEPYVTTKAKGTGLGLAIVKKLVEEHGGTTTAENDAGTGGACISIKLPISASMRETAAGTKVNRALSGRESA
jgi:nitrogen fixation/metabolism regulation signal transduction histidine kinase